MLLLRPCCTLSRNHRLYSLWPSYLLSGWLIWLSSIATLSSQLMVWTSSTRLDFNPVKPSCVEHYLGWVPRQMADHRVAYQLGLAKFKFEFKFDLHELSWRCSCWTIR